MNAEADAEVDAGPGHESLENEARAFIVMAVAAGFAAWEVGFDLGAFDNIDHRRIWAVWILCTVALVASLLFERNPDDRSGVWRFALAVPSLWLIADFTLTSGSDAITAVLVILSVITLPLALYVLFTLLAGDFFTLSRRSQIGLVALTVMIFLVGLYVGEGHERFLTCNDFARAGDFVPADCAKP